MIVVDSNILMYAVGGQHPLQPSSRGFLDAAIRSDEQITTTAGILQEFMYAYARRHGRRDARLITLRYLAVLEPLLVTTDEAVRLSTRIYERYSNLQAMDAQLIATALTEDARGLVSTDQDFADVDGLPHWNLDHPEVLSLIESP